MDGRTDEHTDGLMKYRKTGTQARTHTCTLGIPVRHSAACLQALHLQSIRTGQWWIAAGSQDNTRIWQTIDRYVNTADHKRVTGLCSVWPDAGRPAAGQERLLNRFAVRLGVHVYRCGGGGLIAAPSAHAISSPVRLVRPPSQTGQRHSGAPLCLHAPAVMSRGAVSFRKGPFFTRSVSRSVGIQYSSYIF